MFLEGESVGTVEVQIAVFGQDAPRAIGQFEHVIRDMPFAAAPPAADDTGVDLVEADRESALFHTCATSMDAGGPANLASPNR